MALLKGDWSTRVKSLAEGFDYSTRVFPSVLPHNKNSTFNLESVEFKLPRLIPKIINWPMKLNGLHSLEYRRWKGITLRPTKF